MSTINWIQTHIDYCFSWTLNSLSGSDFIEESLNNCLAGPCPHVLIRAVSACLQGWWPICGELCCSQEQSEREKPYPLSSHTCPAWGTLGSTQTQAGLWRGLWERPDSHSWWKYSACGPHASRDITQIVQWPHYSSKDCTAFRRNFPDPDDEVLECLLDQCFSHFNVHMNHQKILLKHRLWFRGPGLGPEILHVWCPSVDMRPLTWPNSAPPATLWSRRAFCISH